MSESAVWTKNDCKKRLAAQGKMSFIKSLDISVKRLKNCCFDINERILSIFWEVTFWSDFGGDTETGQFTQQCPKLHNTPRGNCLLPRLLSTDWPSVQNLIKKVFFRSKSLHFTSLLGTIKQRLDGVYTKKTSCHLRLILNYLVRFDGLQSCLD